MSCKDCGAEARVVNVTFECSKGHQWNEAVELPGLGASPAAQEDTSKRRLMNIPSRADRDKADEKAAMNNPARFTMPFGKHKGQLLEDIPTDYLQWAYDNLDRLNPSIRQEIENQLILREGKGVQR